MTVETLSPSSIATWAGNLAPARQLAEIVSGTEFVPGSLRGNPDACTACIMYGLEIGIEPMQALNSIHVVDGRPQPSAELMRAMILRAGHDFVVHSLTDQVCRVSGLRHGQDESKRAYVEWSLDQARRAGLANRQNWQRYPRAMLLARATGDLARMAFPDVVKGLGYVSEDQPSELEAWAAQVQPADPEPPVAPKRTRVTRKVATRELPEAVPDGQPEPGAVVGPDPWLKQPAEDPAADRPPVAPGTQPEAPQQASEAPSLAVTPIADRMRDALMANFQGIGVDPSKDRDIRLALTSALLGKPVDSFSTLSRGDGLVLFRLLNDIETGALVWSYDLDQGTVSLRSGRREDG